MSAVVRETERKYDADDALLLPSLTDIAGTVVAEPDEQVLDAVYFDTAALDLARAHVTLRYRGAGWTLKLPVAADSRDEVRVPGTNRRRPPAELARLVRALTLGADLRRVATITTHRQRWRMRDSDGALLAEVVDDRVVARRASRAAPRSWREIEVELGERADSNLLALLDSRLLHAGLHRSSAASKLARVLDEQLDSAQHHSPGPRDQETVGEATLAYLQAQILALRRWDVEVRRDTPDAVHKMRVASRRLRSTFQTFGKVIERQNTRMLTDELKWVAGVLGQSRDLEVTASPCHPRSAASNPRTAGAPRAA